MKQVQYESFLGEVSHASEAVIHVYAPLIVTDPLLAPMEPNSPMNASMKKSYPVPWSGQEKRKRRKKGCEHDPELNL